MVYDDVRIKKIILFLFVLFDIFYGQEVWID